MKTLKKIIRTILYLLAEMWEVAVPKFYLTISIGCLLLCFFTRNTQPGEFVTFTGFMLTLASVVLFMTILTMDLCVGDYRYNFLDIVVFGCLALIPFVAIGNYSIENMLPCIIFYCPVVGCFIIYIIVLIIGLIVSLIKYVISMALYFISEIWENTIGEWIANKKERISTWLNE